eukprot:5629613-Pleurochrysis_carterae.AAC.1
MVPSQRALASKLTANGGCVGGARSRACSLQHNSPAGIALSQQKASLHDSRPGCRQGCWESLWLNRQHSFSLCSADDVCISDAFPSPG